MGSGATAGARDLKVKASVAKERDPGGRSAARQLGREIHGG